MTAMQISNGHPDTHDLVWTIHGYRPRTQLARSQGRQESDTFVARYDEYRDIRTGELVRRDCAVEIKQGLSIGATLRARG